MLSTITTGLDPSPPAKRLAARIFRVVLLSIVALSSFPVAAAAQTTTQPPQFGASAALLPKNVGFYAAVNLAPDDSQRVPLQRLWDYYMQRPEISSSVADMFDKIEPGVSGAEVRQDISAWLGNEAFFAIPTPADGQAIMAMTNQRYSPSRSPDFSEIPIVGGVSVKNQVALLAFMVNMPMQPGSSNDTDVAVTVHAGVPVTSISSGGTTGYVAMPAGWLLFSGSQQSLFDMLDRTAADSLASNPTFQQALRGSTTAPLALIYSDAPGQSFAAPNAPTYTPDFTTFTAATVRFDSRGLHMDQVNGFDASKMTAAQRALLGASPNALKAARLAPSSSAFFLDQTHVDLLWAVVEELFDRSSPDVAQSFHQGISSFEGSSGLSVDRDIFAWMSGEAAFFVSPGGPRAVSGIGGGLVVEAASPAIAQQRVARFMDAVNLASTPDMTVSTEQVSGVTFNKIGDSTDATLYLGAVGPWVVAAVDAATLAGLVQRANGGTDQGLAGDPGFTTNKALMPAQAQSFFFVDVARVTDMILTAAGPLMSGSDTSDVRFYVAPFRRITVAGATTLQRGQSSLFVEIQVP